MVAPLVVPASSDIHTIPASGTRKKDDEDGRPQVIEGALLQNLDVKADFVKDENWTR